MVRESLAPLERVLIADDDETMRLVLTDLLRVEGYHVTEAADGEEAWKALSAPGAPALAVLDWNMPGIDGMALCRQLRETKDHGMLYVIMVTGQGDTGDVVAALDAGADDFLRKPFRREELLARVRAGRRILALSHEKIAMMQQMQTQQRLESIGQLAAGIAHEINTPMQYIGDNTRFLQESIADILKLVEVVVHVAEGVKAGDSCDEAVIAVEAALEAADLDFLVDQIPPAVNQTLDGIDRVTQIVRAMKELAHPGSGDATPTDLNHILETAATVTRNEWKYVSELTLDLSPELPLVSCYPSDLHQAFINIIVNAAHAIETRQRDTGVSEKGRIAVTTARDGAFVEIRISDTGTGIPEAIRNRIMEPFFTTKEVGKGTGQGLAIARSSVVDKHGGDLRFETQSGKGTTFIFRLPING